MVAAAEDLEALVEDFALFDDWEERYRYVIELGRALPPLPEALRTDAHKVSGCMSQVWLVPHFAAGAPPRLDFVADSDALIVKGLIALLHRVYTGRTAPDVLQVDIEALFSRLGLSEHLSPGRRNGFFSMVERLKAAARAQAA